MPKKPAPSMQVEQRDLATLQPYWNNARKNDAAVKPVAESIKRYGWQQPIVVDKKGVIVVGHTRYRAAVELGLETVPVVVIDLPEKQIKEYRIADNKTGEVAKWDEDALIAELRSLDFGDFGVFFEHDRKGLDKMLSDSVGQAVRPVTAEQVDKLLDAGTGVERLITERAVTQFIKVTCPNCCDDFMLDRRTVLNHPGDMDNDDGEADGNEEPASEE